MKLIFKLALISLLLTGCGAAPVKRFPDFYKADHHPHSLNLITDTLVISDISGTKIGINPIKNSQTMEMVRDTLSNNLKTRGYKVEHAFHGNGILFDFSDKNKFVVSENRKSTGELFESPIGDNHNPWLTPESQTFLRRLLSRAKTARVKVHRKFLVSRLSQDEIPQFVKDLPSNYLLFVNTHAVDVSLGKSVGMAFLTATVSAAASGGMAVSSGAPVAGSLVDIAVFDIKNARVVWHTGIKDNTGKTPQLGKKYEEIDQTINELFTHFPMADGSQYIPPKVEEKPKKSGKRR